MGSGSSPPQKLKDALQRFTVYVPVNPNATASAKFDLDDSSPRTLRRRRRRRLRRADRYRSRRRSDFDRNENWHGVTAQAALARLPTPGEQQARSHPMPARDPADRLTSLQGLLNKSDLLVVTPSAPALGAQYLHLH
ncbi:hypothetical protein ABIA00_000414 [Bradyrhizobium ottawaense]